ncbi:Gfo/Idh/MocA family oxidoreductase [Fulvivirga lutea]|uniref:Gfo/Idh/MocA family oxidoreductase n=1 Tax=Fulvivirga lutea TaxID=2810512 RepID=A0A974WK30_9BACT|nr:Gfo/Idh/MocA family oxidoreductase [Fulvivirga lutea]QSE96813.1 Gfo/Idh/MocA family oxidoreductase [Fulvivirga lutea]
MNNKILLIGAGQLGSRHLQALAQLTEPTIIYVIDPNSESLNLAKSRFEEVKGSELHQCNCISNIDEVKDTEVEVSIIATNSAIRAAVVKELLSKLKTKFLILEKFLFQRILDYVEISNLLETNNVTGFVNCPRRMFQSYIQIKSILNQHEPVRMEVIGNEWGLACNSVHFIDLFHFLSKSKVKSWENSLVKGYVESKRKGYIEFFGSLESKTGSQDHISISCFPSGKVNTSVRISTPSVRFIVNESLGNVVKEIIEDNQIITSEQPFEMAYQSGLTNIVVEELISYGKCSLTPYQESMDIHIPFLKTMIEHYNKDLEVKTDLCPIT